MAFGSTDGGADGCYRGAPGEAHLFPPHGHVGVDTGAGGGLGNLVDRVRLGYVVDMFNFQFIRYPVFNVADMLVVGGTILFAAYYLLLHDKVTKKEAADHDGTGEADGGQ